MIVRDEKDAVREIVLASGACRVGFAEADSVDDEDMARYSAWLSDGKHGEMTYLEKYEDLRRDPATLLEGAETIICCAFDYRTPVRHELFADYALGEDYHDVIRRRLSAAAEILKSQFGGETRVCVDTAPVRERYWAARSGLGFTGLNGQLIVDGIGSKLFLAEILWTKSVEPDESRLAEACCGCRACVEACPGRALDGQGGVDARRCLSYLTIEYRGELPADVCLSGRIYGCDICQDVCPYNNSDQVSKVGEFMPSAELMSLGIDDIRHMEQSSFKSIFGHSAVRRTKITGLQRNALRYVDEK